MVKMAEQPTKTVSEVAVENYDRLTEAVASKISRGSDELLRRLIALKVITNDNKQLIRNEKSDMLQAECLLDKYILNRVESGENEVLFTLLGALRETGELDVVSKICDELRRPLPPLGSSGNNDGSSDDGEMTFGNPRTHRLIVEVVVPNVAAYWDTIAAYLEYPIPKTKEIDRHHRGDPKECCRELLQDWFGSKTGVGPKTWNKLVGVLSEISDIAASTVKIRKLLQKEGVI